MACTRFSTVLLGKCSPNTRFNMSIRAGTIRNTSNNSSHDRARTSSSCVISYSSSAVPANTVFAGTAEPTSQYATASIAVTSSQTATLSIFRGASSAVAQIDSVSLEAGVQFTYICPAIESFFRVTLHNTSGATALSTCETYFYEALAAVAPTSDTRSVLIGSTTGSTGGNESTVTSGISVAGYRDCLLHLNPGTGTGLAYFHVFLTTAGGNQYMHGVWSDTGTHLVNWNPSSDSGTCVVAIPAGAHSLFVQLTQSVPYGTHTYTVEVYGRKV